MTLSSIDDVKKVYSKGPWPTKSNGQLNVFFGLDFPTLQKFTNSHTEIPTEAPDIRGLRMYSVDQLSKGAFGANEWHKQRNELVFVVKGSIKWTVVDTSSQEQSYILQPNDFGLWVPPNILHSYESLEDETQILVIANTIFIPEDATTHDTYSAESFMAISHR